MLEKTRKMSTGKKVGIVAGIGVAIVALVAAWKILTPLDDDFEDFEEEDFN